MRLALGNQVSIEARFLTVTENFLEDIGLDLDFSYNAGGKVGLITVTQDSITRARAPVSTRVPGSLGTLPDVPDAINVTGGYGSILDDLQVSLLIRATQGRSDSKSLAAPKVTVVSGETASFSLQDIVTYAIPPDITTTSTSTVGGTNTTQGLNQNVGYLPVGSTLYVTPTITRDKKNVLLNINTTQIDLLALKTHRVDVVVTAVTETTPATIVQEDVTVPETETATVSTRVSIPDGGTLLLGGHKLTEEVDKEVGVPILSKIPILGRLFTNRSKLRDHKVLLILVKPTIILQDESEAEALGSIEGGGAASGRR
jgi:type II secretory pathway component GspD/PulD (secretin)